MPTTLYILIPLIILFAFIAALVKIRTWHIRKNAGAYGEKSVVKTLSKCALPDDKLLNNVTLVNPQNEMSAQIDHIFISTRGIFVIETKNYSGYIYGNDTLKEWTQSLNYGKTVNKFYSPVKQNATHIYLLKKLLNTAYPVFNAVIFVQGNTERIKSEHVYSLKTFREFLKHCPADKIGSSEEEAIYQKIKAIESTEIPISEHISNIRAMKEKIDRNICPRCNGALTLRNGKHGNFYGCSNYPDCKFTKKI